MGTARARMRARATKRARAGTRVRARARVKVRVGRPVEAGLHRAAWRARYDAGGRGHGRCLLDARVR
eukprot:scaffold79592_cov33-Phaeocystis_antarctica.AAC.1